MNGRPSLWLAQPGEGCDDDDCCCDDCSRFWLASCGGSEEISESNTALHWAATNRNPEAAAAAVATLLAAGADVRAKNYNDASRCTLQLAMPTPKRR